MRLNSKTDPFQKTHVAAVGDRDPRGGLVVADGGVGEAVPLQSVQVVVPRHGGVRGEGGPGAVGGGRWDVALPIGAEQKREDRSRASLLGALWRRKHDWRRRVDSLE